MQPVGIEKLKEFEERLAKGDPRMTKEKVENLRVSIFGRKGVDEYATDKQIKDGISGKTAVCPICRSVKTGFRISLEHKQDMCKECWVILHDEIKAEAEQKPTIKVELGETANSFRKR